VLLPAARAVILLLAGLLTLVAIVSALRGGRRIYETIVLCTVATAPLVFISDTWLVGSALTFSGRLFLVLIHAAIGGFVFHLMTLPDRSVTLRILVELELAPDRTLRVADLQQRYGVERMIDARLTQLAGNGYIGMSGDGRLTLLTRGVVLARFVASGRRLFRIESAN
jgi:hypothetical protein